MRDDEADEADETRDADDRADDERAADERATLERGDVDAQMTGLFGSSLTSSFALQVMSRLCTSDWTPAFSAIASTQMLPAGTANGPP